LGPFFKFLFLNFIKEFGAKKALVLTAASIGYGLFDSSHFVSGNRGQFKNLI